MITIAGNGMCPTPGLYDKNIWYNWEFADRDSMSNDVVTGDIDQHRFIEKKNAAWLIKRVA